MATTTSPLTTTSPVTATSSITSSITSSPTSSITSSIVSSIASKVTHSIASTAASTSSAASPTGSMTGGGGGDSTQKPLLFFVALGFGVVFTNLWIIVGVKYCFRYNRRARQALIDSENGGDHIGLGNMQRPRRRREKKLMTMEEVNQRFPLTKYKLWRAAREQEGLPAAGGITAPPSRAASIKDAVMGRPSTDRDDTSTANKQSESSHVEPSNTSAVTIDTTSLQQNGQPLLAVIAADEAANPVDANADPLATGEASASSKAEGKSEMDPTPTPASPSKTQRVTIAEPVSNSEKTGGEAVLPETEVGEVIATPGDDEEDDPIASAMTTELITQPGDTCAICLDSLDDDDDVRGLSCGHAFHAGCLDPWLTSRRACCPLCKADYYVPKPRPEGEPTDANDSSRRQDNLLAPQPVWSRGRNSSIYRPRMMIAGSRYQSEGRDRYGFPMWRSVDGQRDSNNRRPTEISVATTVTTDNAQPERRGFRARYMDAMLSLPRSAAASMHIRHMSRRQDEQAARDEPSNNGSTSATPGQLEAGTR